MRTARGNTWFYSNRRPGKFSNFFLQLHNNNWLTLPKTVNGLVLNTFLYHGEWQNLQLWSKFWYEIMKLPLVIYERTTRWPLRNLLHFATRWLWNTNVPSTQLPFLIVYYTLCFNCFFKFSRYFFWNWKMNISMEKHLPANLTPSSWANI